MKQVVLVFFLCFQKFVTLTSINKLFIDNHDLEIFKEAYARNQSSVNFGPDAKNGKFIYQLKEGIESLYFVSNINQYLNTFHPL